MPTRRARARALVVVTLSGAMLSGLSALHGCTVINGLVLPEPDVVQPAAETAADAPTQSGDGCEHTAVPINPTVDDDPDTKLDMFFALREVSFKEVDDAGLVGTTSAEYGPGFDLDGVCTCTDGGGGSCKSSSARDTCDLANGRDNSLASLVAAFRVQFDLEKRINHLIGNGKSGLLVRVADYNGKPNDKQVSVSFYPSRGICTDAGPPSDANPGGVPNCAQPTFGVGDLWTYDPATVIEAGLLSVFIMPGYVNNGTLVAKFDGRVSLADLDMVLTGATLTARISGPPWTLDKGVIGGRWPVEEAYAAVTRMKTGDTDPPICQSPLAFAFDRGRVCALADIMKSPTEDRAARNADQKNCDAISMGFTFTTAPASLGGPMAIGPAAECPGLEPLGPCQ